MKNQFQLSFLLAFCSLFLSPVLKSQCSASFSISGGSNNTYTFQGLAVPSNSTTTYSWNYGDGYIGNGNSVAHQYNSNGIYTITLNILMSSPNCSASASQTLNVSPPPCPLNSNFTYTINPGGLVNFSDVSTGTTASTSFLWYFGDGNYGSGQATNNTYINNGTYNVALMLSDTAAACSNSVVVPVTISNLPCTLNASFTWFDSNGLVTFNNTSNPQNPIPICTWAFGDGGTSNQVSPSHTYGATGTYTVSLTASQGTCSSTYTAAVTASITPCIVNANFTYTLGTNGLVTFSNTSTNTYSTNNSWNFGDGNVTYSNNNPNHSYSANGTYNVLLTVSGAPFNCYDTITIPVTISNMTCNLTSVPLYFSGNEQYNGVTDFYSNVTYSNTLYSWTFGNGSTSASSTPSTTYSSAGIYTVTLTVTDATNSACSATATSTIQIYYLVCTYNAAFTSTLVSNTLSVSSISTGTSGGVTMLSWDWGDGSYTPGGMNSSTSHTYPFNGTYTVTLFLGDSIGMFNSCYDTTSIIITINSGAPCSVNSNFILQKDTTQLYSWFAYPNYQNNISAATWNWGDGASSTGLFPSHTYSAAGWYNLCLTVSLSCGSQSTTCYNIYLNKTENNPLIYIQVMNPTASLRKLDAEPTRLYLSPNPSSGELTISIGGSVNLSQVTVSIINLLGESVYCSTELLKNSKLDKKVDVSALANGCYFVRVKSESMYTDKKLIITR